MKPKGFTLIELVIVVIVLSIVAGSTSGLLTKGFDAFITGENLVNADWQGRIALEYMTRELRGVRSPASITAATTNQFSFIDANGNNVTYQVVGTQLMRNSQVLADGVQGLTFNYVNQNSGTATAIADIRYVVITLNIIQGGTNFNLATAVCLWSLT